MYIRVRVVGMDCISRRLALIAKTNGASASLHFQLLSASEARLAWGYVLCMIDPKGMVLLYDASYKLVRQDGTKGMSGWCYHAIQCQDS